MSTYFTASLLKIKLDLNRCGSIVFLSFVRVFIGYLTFRNTQINLWHNNWLKRYINQLTMNTLLRFSLKKTNLFLFFTFIGFALIGQNETTKSQFISFYRYIPEKMTWDEHKKRAAIMGGNLACITNADENEQVRRVAGGEIVWVGGIRKGCGNGPGPDHWKWSNGKDWSYTNWRAGEPNNSPSSHDPYSEYDENRVMLWENGEWNDASSLHELSAIYEIPSTSLVTNDTESKQNEINNQPVSYYKFIPEKMTWSEHNNRAIAMGGNLASISNAVENNKVKKVSTGVNVWIGAVRKGCGNDTGADHWYWSSGKKWSYTNWMKNQPDNYQKSENRVHMTPISHGQQWNDISEDHQFSAVYELPIIEESVDYVEDNDIKRKDSKKIKRIPFRIIFGSLLSFGTVLSVSEINSRQKEKQ
mgnify:CR=1 FL=1